MATYSNTPVLSKIKIGTQDYYLKDADARALLTTVVDTDIPEIQDDIGEIKENYATIEYVDAQDAQVLVDAKAYTNEKVGQIILITYEVVTELPTADAAHEFNKSKTIYLKNESGSGKEQDVYGEYICIKVGSNYQWEKIGDTRIDLSNYYTKDQVDAAIKVEADRAKEAEDDLADDIAEVAGGLAAEVTRADTAEKANAAAIAAEVTRATGVEGGLDTRLTTAEGAIDTLEGKVETIEGKPAYNITTQQITNWNNEVGAKAAVEAEEERATGVEEGLQSAIDGLDDRVDAIEGKEDGWDAKLNTVKLGSEFKTVSTDETHGKYVDLGNIAITENVLTGASYTNGKLTINKGDNTTPIDHQFGDLADTDIDDIKAEGQTISGVKATGTSTGELTGALGYASTGMTSTGSVTAAGSVTLNAFTQTATDITSTGKVTAAGDVDVATTEVAASKVKTAGTVATFTEGEFTPAAFQEGFYTAGQAASWTGADYTAPSLGNATTGSFAKKILKPTYTLDTTDSECLVLGFEELTSGTGYFDNAVTAQGTFSAGNVDFGTFDGGSATVINTAKFSGGSKAADTFDGGAMPTFDEVKADKVGTVTFTGSEVNVSVSGQYDKATANGASFSGSAVNVSVSGNYDKANLGTVAFNGKAISLDVGDIVVDDANISKKA